MPDQPLTHLDAAGRAHMVDVSTKASTHRRALAAGRVRMQPETVQLILEGNVAKGDALAVARIAGIQGAKRCADLVPLCHPVRLDKVRIAIEDDPHADGAGLAVSAEVIAFDRTGVEMEAMAAVMAASLALYDMIKGVDRSAAITDVRLLRKEGGRTGVWMRDGDPAREGEQPS